MYLKYETVIVKILVDTYNISQQHDTKMLWTVQFFPNPSHQLVYR